MPRRPLPPEVLASIRDDVVRGERELEAFVRGEGRRPASRRSRLVPRRKSPITMFPIQVQMSQQARALLPEVEKLWRQATRVNERLDDLYAAMHALQALPNFQLSRASALALYAHVQSLLGDMQRMAHDGSEPGEGS